MCLVRDVTCAEDTDDFPAIAPTDYLMQEFRGERTAAMKLVKVIEKKERLTDIRIRKELGERKDRDWFGAGDVMDLTYLSDHASHT
jgi:hypothetical protein